MMREGGKEAEGWGGEVTLKGGSKKTLDLLFVAAAGGLRSDGEGPRVGGPCACAWWWLCECGVSVKAAWATALVGERMRRR